MTPSLPHPPRLLILLATALMLFISALAQPPLESRLPELAEFARSSQHEAWYGIYAAGQKLGYFHTSSRLSDDGEKFITTEDSFLVSTFGEERSEDSSHTETHYSLQDGQVVLVESRTKGAGEDLLIRAKRHGDALLVTTSSGGNRSTKTIPLPKRTLQEEQRFVQWLNNGELNSRFHSFDFEISYDEVEAPIEAELKSRGLQEINGVETSVIEIKQRYRGLESSGTYSPLGLSYNERAGMLEMRSQSKESAERMDGAPIDLLEASTVPIAIKLGNPPPYQLTLLAWGLGDYKFPQSAYQTVNYLGQGRARVKIAIPQGRPPAEELTDQVRLKYLAATSSIQCTDPAIEDVVTSLSLEGRSEREKMAILNHWVFRYLQKHTNVNASTSLAVLKNRSGDCTEHALLLTTLARAAGIPCRLLGGLGYPGDDLGVFGYHAWVEAYIEGGWIPADPTFDEFPASAGHLLQSRDDEQGELETLGTLRLEVESYESTTRRYQKP